MAGGAGKGKAAPPVCMLRTKTMTTEARTTQSPRSLAELTGVVDRIVFCDDSTQFVIAVLLTGETVKGNIDGDGITPTVAYRFLGRWVDDVKRGRQFQFSTFVRDTPMDANGVIKYLVDMCPNIGKRRAGELWVSFGESTIEVVRTQPQRVAHALQIDLKQAEAAAAALQESSEVARTRIDLFGLFHGRGFHGALVNAAIKKWGARAPQIIRRDPFKLLTAKMPSAGFKRVDKLYLDLGNNPARLKRQFFCLWNHLRSDSNGHTWLRAKDACRSIEAQVGRNLAQPIKAAKLGKRAKWLTVRRDAAGEVWLAEAEKARAEWRLSEGVWRLLTAGGDSVVGSHADGDNRKLLWPKSGFQKLSTHQAEHVKTLLTAPLCILAGTPGAGKTYTAAAIIRQVVEEYGSSDVLVCAPTGKAAVRISQALRQYGIAIEATTIHRALEISRNGHDGGGWGFERNLHNPLEKRFVIIDEFSMCDTPIVADLLEACGDDCHVLIIGDPYQLPPVGHGAPLRDLIASGVIPVAELTEIQRNAGQIVHACRAIKEGRRFETTNKYDPAAGLSLEFVETACEADTVATLLNMLAHIKAGSKLDVVWEVQVLCTVNEKSKLARKPLNAVLQTVLNPTGYQVRPNPFRVDDKLICLKNCSMPLVGLMRGKDAADPQQRRDADNYKPLSDDPCDMGGENTSEEYVANGEIGRVIGVSATRTVVKFVGPDRLIGIKHGKLKEVSEGEEQAASDEGSSKGPGCDFDLAYAVTCHKMQGSEAPIVIIPIDGYAGAKRIACREWWYTAISRARQLCVLIGKRSVIDQGCRNVSLQRRRTFLKELLTPAATMETAEVAGK